MWKVGPTDHDMRLNGYKCSLYFVIGLLMDIY